MRGRQTAASRAKAATLKRDLDKGMVAHLDRQKLIDWGKMRIDQGAGLVRVFNRPKPIWALANARGCQVISGRSLTF